MSLEVELSDLSLTYFPVNKKVIVYSYGGVYHKETNFKIALILKEIDKENPEYFMTYINLKDMANFPIGSIIDNQQKLNKFIGLKQNLVLNLEIIEYKMLFEIPELKEKLITSNFPNKIGKYNSKYHIQGQYYFILKDKNTNKNVYIPHYEVARWFYFTTPSMTKQILSASLSPMVSILNGLYKNITHVSLDTKEIILTQNANTNDAANIYRYVTDEYSNNCWNQIRRNLTASAIEIKLLKEDKGYVADLNEMKLKVDFPIKEEISLNARVANLKDGSFLVLKFINEDSSYDFENLFIKIERKNKTVEPVGVIKKKKINKTKLSKKITNNIPQVEISSVIINNESEDFEERLDLKTKKIEKIIEYKKEKEFIELETNLEGDIFLDLSTKDAEISGDSSTVNGNMENENPEIDDREYLTLSDFKAMLFECAKEIKEFSFNIQKEDYLPQKPENDTNKKRKWRKSKLQNDKTKRRYLAVLVNYNDKNFTLIEIERDILVDGLSTLIIWDNDYSKIDNDIVYSIVKNFVYENGRWLKNYKDFVFNKDFLEHPKDENNSKLKEWYLRLKTKIKL